VSLTAGHDNISEFDEATNNALDHLAKRVVAITDRLTS
jgi:NAD(P)H dehydrogenase (quinone)